MLHQDYILREIERMIQFYLRAVGLKTEDEAGSLHAFLEENSETVTGLPLDTLLASPAQKLVSLFYHPGTAKLPQLVGCGVWLCEAADVRRLDGDLDSARDLFQRGAQLLAFLNAHHGASREFAPLEEHLQRLLPRLDELRFSPDDRSRLIATLTTPPGGIP